MPFFTFEVKKEISNVCLLYYHCHFYCPLKEAFLYRNFKLGPRKFPLLGNVL